MSKKDAKDPLEPISGAVSGLLVLTVLGGVIGLAVLVANVPGASAFGIGSDAVCATSTQFSTAVDYPRAIPGVNANSDGIELCAQNPSTYQTVLSALTQLPAFLAFLGTLILIRRVIRCAQRKGIYSAEVPGAVRDVGAFLVIVSLVVTLGRAVAESSLIASMTVIEDDVLFAATWDVPVISVLTGLGLLTFARIMRIGAEMRADLDGTV